MLLPGTPETLSLPSWNPSGSSSSQATFRQARKDVLNSRGRRTPGSAGAAGVDGGESGRGEDERPPLGRAEQSGP
ncbi:hypothetical protein XA68_10786 [Ophiocordyceps unilateralis]|uniref:Uncharacterized protein n=1 Tax=Ophiocordyceps unilateralis TaxID=268505 RepID=A0A2A9PI33_OPHUN|nr:hypothetical protein XA68_10786 [Ophiocordyceps unilateralis]